MTITALLLALQSHLAPLVTAARGTLDVAETEYDAITALADGPQKMRIILAPGGCDNSEGGDDHGGYVMETIQLFLQAPKANTNDSGKGLLTSHSGVPSFLTRQQWLIKQVRGLSIEHEEIDNECGRTFRFRDWDFIRLDDGLALMRASRIRFHVRYIFDAPEAAEPTTPPVIPSGGLVPPGGGLGQILAKASAGNFDTEWIDPPAGGGGDAESVSGITFTWAPPYLLVTKNGITKRLPLSNIPA